jgi:hypothetical protein
VFNAENFMNIGKGLRENVLKIRGFIWNIKGNILVWKYFWPVNVDIEFC